MNREARYYRDLDDGFISRNDWPSKESNQRPFQEPGKSPEDDLIFFKDANDWLLLVLFIASIATIAFILGTA